MFLEALEIHFHVIVLSEIGARNIGTVEHLLSNYDFYYVLPQENNFWEVGIYVHNDYGRSQYAGDLSMLQMQFWNLFIKFIYRRKGYILGGIYHHPNGSIQQFLTNLEDTLSKISNKHTAIPDLYL